MIASILPLNRVLLALTAALVALLFVLRGSAIETRSVEPLLSSFDAALATEVRIVRPGAESVVTLERPRSGAEWTIRELYGGPASAALVDGFLARVGAMTTLDLVSEDPARFDEYELGEDQAVRITVRGGPSAGEDALAPADVAPVGPVQPPTLADLYVSSASATAVYVRRAGDAGIYRIPRLRVPWTDPFRWFDRAPLVPYENVQIARVAIGGAAFGGDELVVEQPADRFGSFQGANGEALPGTVARELLQRLRALYPAGVQGRGEGAVLDEGGAALVIEVRLRTGGTSRLLIGATGPDGAPARRDDEDLVVLLDGRAVDGVVEAVEALSN